MNIPYEKAKNLIHEGDVLLFRAGKFPQVGWWIGKYTNSKYSHAGLSHWENDQLYCLEFREFLGSRQYLLDSYINEKANIDVFRPLKKLAIPKCDKEYNIQYETYEFSDEIATNITNTAKHLLGQKYSYWTIWHIFKTYIPFVRLRTKVYKNGTVDTNKFVCSTLITYTYRKNYVDPVPFLSDEYTTPGDLSRSLLFSYLFSING